MVSQTWIIECLQIYKISDIDEVINFIPKVVENCKVELAKEDTPIQRKIIYCQDVWMEFRNENMLIMKKEEKRNKRRNITAKSEKIRKEYLQNTIKHVLIECKVYNNTRKHYFHANTIENVHMDDILSFLKETRLYQKI